MMQGQKVKNFILLDRGSTTSLFWKTQNIANINNTLQPMQIQTDGGDLEAIQECQVPDLGDVFFHPDAMNNIIGLCHMRVNYWVAYNSEIEPVFFVHTPNKIMNFPETKDGLYTINMDNINQKINDN